MYMEGSGTIDLNKPLTKKAADAVNKIGKANYLNWAEKARKGDTEFVIDDSDSLKEFDADFLNIDEAISPLGYVMNGRVDYWGDYEGCYLIDDSNIEEIDKEDFSLRFSDDQIIAEEMKRRGYVFFKPEEGLKISVTVNNGGTVDGVYSNSDNLKDVSVEIIDFCTDDPKEKQEAEEAWEDLKSQKPVQLY